MTKDEQSYSKRENLWDEQWPTPSNSTSTHNAGELDNEDVLSPFPDTVGTSDVIESVRDGEPYIPPMDPPVLPGGPEGIHVASGFASSAEIDESDDAPRGDEELHDKLMRLLANDSLTSEIPFRIAVRNGVVHLVGEVQSMDDADYAANLLEGQPGVLEVVDNTRLAPTGV